MIHDVLLSCLNLYSMQLPIEEILVSDAVSTFLHPCETSILHDIIEIINLLRDVAQFSNFYGNNHDIVLDASASDTNDSLQKGLYLSALANGLHIVLEEYLVEISELERRYLQNPTQSLFFIFQKIQIYKPLALFLRKLIRGIRMQKLHGCAIVQYLYQNTQHGDKRIYTSMKILQSSVNAVFLKQLTHWMLYAKIVDCYGEFFIQCYDTRNNRFIENDKGASTGSVKHTDTTLSDAATTYADIWRYEVFFELLPHYMPSNWAENVLFIGQTVLIFKVDRNKINKNAQIWNNNTGKNSQDCEDSLWNGKEHIYFGKMQALKEDEINVSHYEGVVNEIKNYVTERLSEIAVNRANLVQQLRLIKEYFLLGRGEFFLEFIRQTYTINNNECNENKQRDFVKAFESAAHIVGVPEVLEQFSIIVISKNGSNYGNAFEFGNSQHLCLQYKINWPLHLLFSPKVMERYNMLFRFFLLVKRMQYALQMMWCRHTRESKRNKPNNFKVMHLRNQLMFFVDNLQYYIQVDVLETQFNVLLNTILNKADFEQIQRAHSVFLANVMSLCFLLADDDDLKVSSILQSSLLRPNNPVCVILNDIFYLCEDVFGLLNQDEIDEFGSEIDAFDERLGNLIKLLINLLLALKEAPCTAPLSQLLLRLDFNCWFSWRSKGQDAK